MDPKNADAPWSKEKEQYWMPVDLYVGGAEHAVLHLLYSRFWHKVLFDAGYVAHDEPFARLVHQGLILGEDNEKMSKSRGNVVNPDDIVKAHGADCLRMYEMFMGPLEAVKPWQSSQIQGVVRFRDRVWAACTKPVVEASDDETRRLVHRTIQKVTSDVEALSFNTAISAMMVLTNHLTGLPAIPREAAEALTLLLAPFAPHLCEELWKRLGHDESLAHHAWPSFDPALCVDDVVELAVQVNGKVRGRVRLARDASEADAKAAALAAEGVAAFTDGKSVKKFVYVPARIVNLVVG
jgi:leucyl-tRNA synthetase